MRVNYRNVVKTDAEADAEIAARKQKHDQLAAEKVGEEEGGGGPMDMMGDMGGMMEMFGGGSGG